MKEDVKLVDLVIELVDARAPLASRNPDIDSLAAGKGRVILLNKADLASEKANAAWISYFEGQGFQVMKIDARWGSRTWENPPSSTALPEKQLRRRETNLASQREISGSV